MIRGLIITNDLQGWRDKIEGSLVSNGRFSWSINLHVWTFRNNLFEIRIRKPSSFEFLRGMKFTFCVLDEGISREQYNLLKPLMRYNIIKTDKYYQSSSSMI